MSKMIQSLSFSGHETFTFRYGWLKKAYDAVIRDPEIFGRDYAMVDLGVGKNMVKSMRHWALAVGVVTEDPQVPQNRGRVLIPTRWGHLMFADSTSNDNGFDPFLEDVASLWLLHWRIATNPARNTTWYWTFNYWKGLEFSKDKLMAALISLAESSSRSRLQPASLKRDIDCFVRTYVAPTAIKGAVPEESLDCPLVELSLISEMPDHTSYRFHQGHQASLPNEIFAYCLLDFWERKAPTRDTLAFEDIAYAPTGPGRVLKLDDDSLVERLNALQTVTMGALSFDQTAGLRQVYRRRECDSETMLRHYYRFEMSLVGGRR